MEQADKIFLTSDNNTRLGVGVTSQIGPDGSVTEVPYFEPPPEDDDPEAALIRMGRYFPASQKDITPKQFVMGAMDIYAGMLKGLVQQWVGIGGDAERITTAIKDAMIAGAKGENILDGFLNGLGKDGTLLWDTDDAAKVIGSAFEYKPITPAGQAQAPGGKYVGEYFGEASGLGGQGALAFKVFKTIVNGTRKMRGLSAIDVTPPTDITPAEPFAMPSGQTQPPPTASATQAPMEASTPPTQAQQTAAAPEPMAAPRSSLGFYSAVEQAIMNLQRKSGNGQAFINDIMKAPDVKKDELAQTGLLDFLAGQKNIKKEDVLDWFRGNKTQVSEGLYGAPRGYAIYKDEGDNIEYAYDPKFAKFGEGDVDAAKQELVRIFKLSGRRDPDYSVEDVADDFAYKNDQDYINLANSELINYRASELRKEYLKIELSGQYAGDVMGAEKYDELMALLNIKEGSTTTSLYQEQRSADINAAKLRKRKEENPDSWNDADEELLKRSEAISRLAGERAEALDLRGLGVVEFPQPKFDRYTLPGGTNERELVLTQEGKTANWVFKDGDEPIHYEDPDVLAHIRFNDRVDADGKKVLLVEEVQSDLHQQGKQHGYMPVDEAIQNSAREEELIGKIGELERSVENLYADWKAREQDFDADGRNGYTNAEIADAENDWEIEAQNLEDAQNELYKIRSITKVPDAPFKENWYELALKRALKYAADNGYDRIALTTGRQQLERYRGLSQQVIGIKFEKPEIKINPDKENEAVLTFVKLTTRGNASDGRGPVITFVVDKDGIIGGVGLNSSRYIKNGQHIKDVLGKKYADELEKSRSMNAEKLISLEGKDVIEVGGEGMRTYYDKKYPSFLEKHIKKNKWGGESGTTTITGGHDVRYFDITPKMRQSLAEKGQPLYSAAAPIATGAGSATIAKDEDK